MILYMNVYIKIAVRYNLAAFFIIGRNWKKMKEND